MTPPTILDKILSVKRAEVAAAKSKIPLIQWQHRVDSAPAGKGFLSALLAAPPPLGLIAEVKRASPSAGMIRSDFDPLQIALAYQQGGATCLSVLTDEHFFQGSLDYLSEIRQHLDIPLLRKDFIIDPYQVWEARGSGADCILLIAECLHVDELMELYRLSQSLGMDTLIEVHDQEHLPAVVATGCPLIGINNRDLRTFATDLEHSVRLRAAIPEDRLVVAESGIRSHDDLQVLARAGIRAVLVGESLMREPDIQQAVQRLLHGGEQPG